MGSRDEGHIRIFLSVDLVGSTAFKNSPRSESESRLGPAWANVFVQFYNGFPLLFERTLSDSSLPTDIRPTVIKALGDELLLQTEVQNHNEARRVVQFFALAMSEYKRKNLMPYSLLLKGTAWIAGFPNNNHKVTLAGAKGHDDFIGPSMDTGFRLAKHAKPAKLIVSVDLALLMLNGHEGCRLYCDGFEPLQGVLDGRPYPILWYLVATEDHELQSLALKVTSRASVDQGDLSKYCEQFIKEAKGTWLCRPYFKQDQAFETPPPEHLALYQRADEFDARNNAAGEDPSQTNIEVAVPVTPPPDVEPRKI